MHSRHRTIFGLYICIYIYIYIYIYISGDHYEVITTVTLVCIMAHDSKFVMPFVGSFAALVCYNPRPSGCMKIICPVLQPFHNQCLTPLHLLIASQVITSVQISAFLEGRTQQDSQQANFPLRPILGLVNILFVVVPNVKVWCPSCVRVCVCARVCVYVHVCAVTVVMATYTGPNSHPQFSRQMFNFVW